MECRCHSARSTAIPGLIINQVDPTRTLTLRNRFVADMRRRFSALARVVRISIVDNDCFGLNTPQRVTRIQTAAQPGQFDFNNSSLKVTEFMAWLQEQYQEYIFSGGTRGINIITPSGRVSQSNWTDIYIQAAYQRGIQRAREELRKAGVDIPINDMPGTDEIQIAFNQPFHADRVGLLYTRTFTDLRGITNAMDIMISRALAQGMAEGRGALELASILERIITGMGQDFGMFDSLGRWIPGKRRAEILARTEIIRAHHMATINEYERAGVLGVTVKAEWSTAGDSRVCSICASMDGRVYDLKKIRGMIPAHPQCRCVALPWFPEVEQ